MKTATAEHKRGDTFLVSCTRADTDISDWEITSMIRDAEGALIAECEVTITDASEGQFTLLVEDTTDWPVDYLNWDIQYVDSGGVIRSTETIKLRVRADVTYPEPD